MPFLARRRRRRRRRRRCRRRRASAGIKRSSHESLWADVSA